MPDTRSFDVAIIGGGSGLTAATHALGDGRSVALIDARPDAIGGTCVNRGCLPTKGLIQSARTIDAVRASHRFGVTLDQSGVKADFPAIMHAIRAKRKERAGGAREWVEKEMTPFFGKARFVDDALIEMEDGARVTADRIFVCSGARPSVPPVEGLEKTPYLTNRSVLELDERPRSMLVVGGGYIGCELGYFFSAMGTDVTVVHPHQRLLEEDHEIGDLFTAAFGERVRLELGARAHEVSHDGGAFTLTIKDDHNERPLSAEALLVATGRTPNTDALDLDATGVETGDNGWITVDDHLRTSHDRIYAYGDVIGKALFKHTSSYEGTLAYDNAFGGSRTVDYGANPHAVFSDPEIAAVGLTEQECKARNLDYVAASVPYDGIAKGEIVGAPAGLAKAIAEKKTGRILGYHVAGPHAAIIVHEIVLAMHAGLTADRVASAIHIHPSMGELTQTVFSKVS